jgi:hypothetical protein
MRMNSLSRDLFKRFGSQSKQQFRRLTTLVAVSSLPALIIVRQFLDAGALSPVSARPFRPQSLTEQFQFTSLRRIGVIREPTPGRYFLDLRTLPVVSAKLARSRFLPTELRQHLP